MAEKRDFRTAAEVLLNNAGAGIRMPAPTDAERVVMALQGIGYAILAGIDGPPSSQVARPSSAPPPPPPAPPGF